MIARSLLLIWERGKGMGRTPHPPLNIRLWRKIDINNFESLVSKLWQKLVLPHLDAKLFLIAMQGWEFSLDLFNFFL